jgi:hypothetical protein
LGAWLLGLQGEEGAAGPGGWISYPYSPTDRQYSFIHSFIQQIHIYQVLPVPGTVLGKGGGGGREMNEETSESPHILDPAFPWLPGLVALLSLTSVSLSVIIPANGYLLSTYCGLGSVLGAGVAKTEAIWAVSGR